MWFSLFSNAAASFANGYNQYVWSKANNAINEAQEKIDNTLAGISLTQTMNTAAKAKTEVIDIAKRKEAGIEREVIAARGELEVQAATTGATGKRVQLAQEQATAGAADRAKAELRADTAKEYDAILDQEQQAVVRTVSNLLAAPIDVPQNFDIGAALIDFGTKSYSIYQDWQKFEDAREADASS